MPITDDATPISSEETKPQKANNTEEGFFKTQATETTKADTETAKQALAPLANLPTPVSQLIAGTNGSGMAAPQIYVINAGGTPTPPPIIDMEVDTTPSQPNNGLLGLTPTTTVSLHEGAAGGVHHAEGHHGGSKFNWFNGFFPFPISSGEAFPWFEQFSSGFCVGAALAFLANAVGLLFEDDYSGPLVNCLKNLSNDLDKVWAVGPLLGGGLRFFTGIFEPKGIVHSMYDEQTRRRYKVILRPADGSAAYAQASKVTGLSAKIHLTGGYTDFVTISTEQQTNGLFNTQIKKHWFEKFFSNKLPSNQSMKSLTYTDLAEYGKQTLVQFIGDLQQPQEIRLYETVSQQPTWGKIYQFDATLQAYKLISISTIDNNAKPKELTLNWESMTRLYVPTNTALWNTVSDQLTQPKQVELEALKSSGLKTLNEIAPIAQELLGGIKTKKQGHPLLNIVQQLGGKYVPIRGMILGGFIGSLLAMYLGFYEAGHKHLGIETHGGGGDHGKGKDNEKTNHHNSNGSPSEQKPQLLPNFYGKPPIIET